MKRSMMRGTVATIAFVFFLFFACYLAYAFSAGVTGQTKKHSATAGCGAKISGGGGCHGVNSNASIQVALSGPTVLPVGTPGTYTIVLTGATTSGGGCDIAVSSGTLSSTSSLLQVLNQELTHVSPIGTPYSIEFTYLSNSPGTVTMYANGKASGGWNWAPELAIRIGPPSQPVLLLPADGSSAVPTSTVLSWSGVQGAQWTVEVSTSQAFGTVLLRRESLTDTAYTIPEGVLPNNTKCYWRVRATDSGGTGGWSQIWSFSTALTAVEETPGQLPAVFALAQNYPNPFNPNTEVRYEVPGISDVRLVVYDLLGREVATLVNETQQAGRYEVAFDGTGLASGIYVYQITAGSFVQARKMLLTR